MASRIMSGKARQVNENLKAGRSYRSDQGAVWDSIHQMSAEARVHSSTGAMRDVSQAKQDELDEHIQSLGCEPGQKGSIVFINGTIVEQTTTCDEKRYESVGLGWDYRYEAQKLVRSALVFDEHVIHAAFFPMKQSEKTGAIAGHRRRRAYRTQTNGGHYE